MKSFPDKLQNMNGYHLKGGLYNYPPYSRANYKHKGHLVDYGGADFLTFKALSKVLNLTGSIVSSVNTIAGIYDLKNESASGLIRKCINNEIKVLLATLISYNPSKKSIIERTRMLDWESIYAVLLIFPSTEEVDILKVLLGMPAHW